MSYPGAATYIKQYIRNSIWAPVLTYGLESINVNVSNMNKLETIQGNLIKQSLGLSKRCHSTELLQSMNVHTIDSLVNRNTVFLFKRIMNMDLNLYFLSLYLNKEVVMILSVHLGAGEFGSNRIWARMSSFSTYSLGHGLIHSIP